VRLAFVVSFFIALGLSVGCGTTTPACTPTSCSGCCTADDRCVSGTSTNECGSNGLRCDVCVGAQTCSPTGRCQLAVTPPDAGPPDAGAPDAGEPDAGPQPITAPNEQWTWVDVPGTACGNGSPTGLGVNLTTRSNDVIIYLQGGGACWSQLTCSIGIASDLDGYGSAKFATDSIKGQAPFNRVNANNPFKDASFVFIPYCTGDVHIGSVVAPWGTHHKGASNIGAFLERLKPTFPNARRIWVTGTSAGGFGAQLNYHRFAAAFPNAEVHALADSAQMLNPASPALLAEWVAAWDAKNPPGCTGCTMDFNLVPAWLSTTYPNRRFALLGYSQDNVLAPFFGYQQPGFTAATTALLAGPYLGKANLKYFIVDPAQPSHVMLNQLFTRTAGGVPLRDFARQFAFGEPGWASVRGP